MILTRFAGSLRRQDWSTISIEFVLLMVGVLLGIQVANWNEARARLQQSTEFTERLVE